MGKGWRGKRMKGFEAIGSGEMQNENENENDRGNESADFTAFLAGSPAVVFFF
jgi:hypothetical protein